MNTLFDLYRQHVAPTARLSYSGFTVLIDGVSTPLKNFIQAIINAGVDINDIPPGFRRYYSS